MNITRLASLSIGLLLSILFFVLPFRVPSENSRLARGDSEAVSLFEVTLDGFHLRSFQRTFSALASIPAALLREIGASEVVDYWAYVFFSTIFDLVAGLSVFIPLVVLYIRFFGRGNNKYLLYLYVAWSLVASALIIYSSMPVIFGLGHSDSQYSNFPTVYFWGLLAWMIFGVLLALRTRSSKLVLDNK